MSQFKTDLSDYTLWFDGVIEVDPQNLEGLFLKNIPPSRIAVSEVTPDLVRYNRLAKDKITTKEEIDAEKISFDWNIPPEYLALNIEERVWAAFWKRHPSFKSQRDKEARTERICREIYEYTSRGLLDVLRVLVYTIDTFKKNNVVWGVGRGSSCASYLLYLLEVHSVDPVKYEIPLEEFFK
jgi:DNA polymerase III alpha subunit